MTVRLMWLFPLLAAPLCPQIPPEQVEFFEKKIRPVLAEKCYACHGEKVRMAELRLDSRDGTRKGGSRGPAVVPSEPDRSLLLQAISYRNLDLKMPPTGKLSDAEIDAFREWVRMGAPDPRSAEPAPEAAKPKGIDFDRARRFWAFRPFRNHPLPEVKRQDWPSSPIDYFLLSALEAKGLAPAPAADKTTLLRRATFDLIGLPPTVEQMRAFLADDSPEAFEKVVDRLLSSPHYGERWARHWLDLVRFAETNGHEFDNDKLDSWRYRDYVIRAFQEDVPYDRFVREHIAGDLLPEPRLRRGGAELESPVATTFYWFGEVLNSATDSVKTRADRVDNQIDVVSKAFLGLTVACARCHDHKFDPLPTADYYSLAGIMHSTEMIEASIDSPERADELRSSREKIAALNDRIWSLIGRPEAKPESFTPREGDTLFEDFEKPAYGNWIVEGQAFSGGPSRLAPPNQPLAGHSGEALANSFAGSDRFTGTLTSQKFRMPKLYVHVRMGGSKDEKNRGENAGLRFTVVADDHKSGHITPDGDGRLAWKTIRMTKEIGRLCYIEIVDRSREGHIVIDKIVFSDSKEPPAEEEVTPAGAPEERADAALKARLAGLQAERKALEDRIPHSAFGMIAMDENPANVRIHVRGNHKNLGEEAPRWFLRVIAGDRREPFHQGSGRAELALAMSAKDNPLTARVMVNRIWQHHFGEGLVRSVDNFGQTGDRPTHPELLDSLAARFVESGWSVKAMHRMMVLSSAYRMSSQTSEAALKADPQNKLLHHMPVRRLEAEAIRDSILAVSGRLDPTAFGPSVPPHVSAYQDGRGKPKSGPLDGAGRRSIYIQVRRNFLTPMFLAFDYPLPISTIGRRSQSTVPSQALMLMNNEFVAQQAGIWAERVAAAETEPERRLERMYLEAFGRAPDAREREESLAFLARQQGDGSPWAELAHILFNSAEFIYVR